MEHIQRRRAGSVVSEIAMNMPILDDFLILHDGIQNEKIHRRAHSFNEVSFGASAAAESAINNQWRYLDPLNLKEKDKIIKLQTKPFNTYVDIPFNDYCLIENEHEPANDFVEYMQLVKNKNNGFLNSVNDIIKDLDNLLEIHDEVTNQTSEFQNKSTDLIGELSKMEKLHNELVEKLSIFETLDPIVSKLNKNNNIKSIMRSNILSKLDVAIKFVNDEKHFGYKEIDLYQYRFKQCLIRALSLIRTFLVKSIKNLELDVISSIQLLEDKQSSVMVHALVNTKFLEGMVNLYPYFMELYQRSNINDESFNLLDDVYNQYFKSRFNIIQTFIINPYILNSENLSDDLLELSQSNLSFFGKTLEKESEIFEKSFFLTPIDIKLEIDNSTNLTAMNEFMEILLDPLYYLLRNRIIRETKINSLCELITILQAYTESEQQQQQHEENEEIINNSITGIDYNKLYAPIIEDVQTRLVFRVQMYVEKNIVNYKRTGKELIIENRKEIKSKGATKNEQEGDGYECEGKGINNSHEENFENRKLDQEIDTNEIIFSDSLKDESKILVYPPILKSVKLLTKIYTLVKQPVFDDLCASIVHLCILSLQSNFPSSSDSLDSKLYKMKSLIWFKDGIGMFDIEHVQRETNLDFTGLRNLYASFLQTGKAAELNSSQHQTLFDKLWGSIPTIKNDFVDCRIELQIELRNVVHEFIDSMGKNLTLNLQLLTSKINHGEKISSNEIHSAVGSFTTAIEGELPRIKECVATYIDESKIFEFLLDGIQDVVVKKYGEFYDAITELSISKESADNEELISGIIELDEVNNLWADTVKRLFLQQEQSGEMENLMKELDDLDLDGDMESTAL
ncbi:Golgi transport complex subunit [Martiniozyma asiatica (nom. inval.)]|nr:Golgi transport complex subunit [Martiniozyma asiatica]